jgi:hypothetical protein
MEEADYCETLVTFYQTSWHHIPEDHNLTLIVDTDSYANSQITGSTNT